MKKIDFTKIMSNAKGTIVKHSPELLIGIGIAGMVSAAVMAVTATPKALDVMAELTEKYPEEAEKKEKGKEIITKVAPVYIPALITGTLSAACIIGANSVNTRRNAALATAYTLSENALKEYQSKVIEVVGEKKEKAIKEAVAKEQLEKNPVTNCEVYITEKGNTLFYDTISGRYFTSDMDKVKKIENELNKRLLSEMYISLNELYYELGLRCTPQGNDLGFNINDGLIDIDFSPLIADDDRPCIAISYHTAPRYGYGDLH